MSYPGVRLQMKLLDSALSSLLQCQTILPHYQPHQADSEATDEVKQQEEEEGEGEGRGEDRQEGGEGNCDVLVTLLLTRLLGILKQLVAVVMKKRYILHNILRDNINSSFQ